MAACEQNNEHRGQSVGPAVLGVSCCIVCLFIDVCLVAGGVLFPCGVSVSDCGGGDAHPTGAC